MQSWNRLLNAYEVSIATQSGVIERYRFAQKKALRSGNFNEVQRVNSILRVLYEEKGELEESAARLRQYLMA
ncbi:MAG: hypothetical protein IJU56_07985 [Clostridia bacterium]|nr:hypothetical protein [Clostridia bacterium]